MARRSSDGPAGRAAPGSEGRATTVPPSRGAAPTGARDDFVDVSDGGVEWPSGGGWEVESLPSEAEGGIVGLLLGDARRGTSTDPDGSPASPDAHSADLDPLIGMPAGLARPEPSVSGRARLNEMLDLLPLEPAPRLTPDDIEVEQPALAPPAVWFWGDDDIYPGKVQGRRDQPRFAPRRGLRLF